jgi:hypothetical protein
MARYVLLQRSLDPLPIKRLARAFVASGARISLDAPAVARTAYGLLLDDLTATAASRLAHALEDEGIEVEALEESHLPALPRTRWLRHVSLGDEGITWFSSLERGRLLPWAMIRIAALGSIRRRPRTVMKMLLAGEDEALETQEIEDPVRNEDLVLDLVCDGEPARVRIVADEFSYACLGSRMRPRARENFPLLAREILERCDVMPNRGAARFHLGHPEWFTYPNWSAFEEETRWLLWKAAWFQQRGEREPPSGRRSRQR